MAKMAIVIERDDSGQVSKIPVELKATQRTDNSTAFAKTLRRASSSPWKLNDTYPGLGSLYHILSDFFLPAGYPASVSPDYLEYQIYNALQTFCNSLSGLLASRGALQGVGVGDASTSATYALLLTVLKDIFSRLTTILGAYYFGTSLYPETKTFRYLADVFNDAATVLDTIVPFIGSIDTSVYCSILPSGAALQVIALCLSGGMRSLCVLVAGGSKAALTNHFASPLIGKGDVGEVSAKDASRETVIGLSGMLLGTLLIPYVNTHVLTHSILFVLVGAHLFLNYLAVRSVVLRTLNRQRVCILWTSFKAPNGKLNKSALRPTMVASKEALFGSPCSLRDASTGKTKTIGQCVLGTSFRSVTSQCAMEHIASALHVFEDERYTIFITCGNRHSLRPANATALVCFKDGYLPMDQLQAWIHAIEVTRRLSLLSHSESSADLGDILRLTLQEVRKMLPDFIQSLFEAGWETKDDSMMFGSPAHLTLGIIDQENVHGGNADKKDR